MKLCFVFLFCALVVGCIMSRIVENLLTKPEKSSKVKLADYTDEELLDELKRRTNEHRKP